MAALALFIFVLGVESGRFDDTFASMLSCLLYSTGAIVSFRKRHSKLVCCNIGQRVDKFKAA